MSWLRIDDGFWEHPKVLECGPSALGLWLLAASWASSRKPRDGFIPRGFIGRLVKSHPARAVAELVAVGLWDEADGGWVIHDFSEYGPPGDLSQKRADAGRKGGLSKQANALALAKQTPKQLPSKGISRFPIPEPVNSLFPTVRESAVEPEIVHSADDPVGVFVDAHKALGLAAPTGRAKGRLGTEAKRLLGEGKPHQAVLEGCRELVRRNATPANLEYIVGDVERRDAGISMQRAFEPPENPVDRDVRLILERGKSM